MYSKLRKSVWLVLIVLTSAYLVAIAVDATPYLRGPAPMSVEWRWRRFEALAFDRLWVLLLAVLFSLALIAWIERLPVEQFSPRRRILLLFVLVVSAWVLQASVLYQARPDVLTLLFDRNVSHSADGYYSAALQIEDLPGFLRTYPERMPTFASDHPRTHPPGFALLHWAVGRTLGRWPPLQTFVRWNACPTLRVSGLAAEQVTSALVVGVVTPLVSVLALLPAYALARRHGGERAGFRAAALFCLVPALFLFAPQMDVLYPLLTGLILWAFVLGWEKRSRVWFGVSGVVLSLATFVSLGLLALVFLLGIYALVRWLAGMAERERWTWQELVAGALSFGVGVASIWVLCWLAFGLDPVAVYRTGLAQHYEIVTARRNYWLWVWYNLYDGAAFLGLPLSLLYLAGLVRSIRSALRGDWKGVHFLGIATAVTLVVLDVSGTSRGEVARLWLLFLPPVVLATIPLLADRRLFVLTAVLQGASLIVFSLVLNVVPYLPLPAVDRTQAPPPLQGAWLASFGDVIAVEDYTLSPLPANPGESLTLTLRWRALGEPARGYKVFVHLLDGEGTARAQVDGVPLDWTLPTNCWVAGEVVQDRYVLALPADLPPGDYVPIVGWYDSLGARLPAEVGEWHSTAGGAPVSVAGDHIRLQDVRVATQP